MRAETQRLTAGFPWLGRGDQAPPRHPSLLNPTTNTADHRLIEMPLQLKADLLLTQTHSQSVSQSVSQSIRQSVSQSVVSSQ
jgi:hypothetical protein